VPFVLGRAIDSQMIQAKEMCYISWKAIILHYGIKFSVKRLDGYCGLTITVKLPLMTKNAQL
jgi:hypothetical protein